MWRWNIEGGGGGGGGGWGGGITGASIGGDGSPDVEEQLASTDGLVVM